jgi:hypothetical protein
MKVEQVKVYDIMAMTAVLRRMGLRDTIIVPGFRSTFPGLGSRAHQLPE